VRDLTSLITQQDVPVLIAINAQGVYVIDDIQCVSQFLVFKGPVVIVCINSLTVNNSAFVPWDVFMGVVFILILRVSGSYFLKQN
jgi:hypothetical protein